jgi:hypothetical protein
MERERTSTDFTRPEAYSRIADRLSGPPRHVVIRSASWRDEVYGLIADIRANPFSHLVAAALGSIAGLAAIIVPAILIVALS